MELPQATLTIQRNLLVKNEIQPEILEGEFTMPDANGQPTLKEILGDNNARVTVSRQLCHKDFGNGGDTFVSISIGCNQDELTVGWAAYLANKYATEFAEVNFQQLRQRLVEMGIVKA